MISYPKMWYPTQKCEQCDKPVFQPKNISNSMRTRVVQRDKRVIQYRKVVSNAENVKTSLFVCFENPREGVPLLWANKLYTII